MALHPLEICARGVDSHTIKNALQTPYLSQSITKFLRTTGEAAAFIASMPVELPSLPPRNFVLLL